MFGNAVYAILVWLPAAIEDSYIGWLEGGHLAEVVKTAGFLNVRRIAFDQTDSDNRRAHLIIYEAPSKEVVDAYINNPARTAYIKDGQRFEGVRAERFGGQVAYTS
ncbi:DUF4286 family protein [Govanella unica]|uniref:Uncharacterized protein n=1 Tax=Govanella unica TaxID=2975056 RepID=A0A9X3Z6T1_9PROT|nr:DUF4286 family protein [Govania unica]MDA5193427.1 hypothetical protein [Govania unica]